MGNWCVLCNGTGNRWVWRKWLSLPRLIKCCHCMGKRYEPVPWERPVALPPPPPPKKRT